MFLFIVWLIFIYALHSISAHPEDVLLNIEYWNRVHVGESPPVHYKHTDGDLSETPVEYVMVLFCFFLAVEREIKALKQHAVCNKANWFGQNVKDGALMHLYVSIILLLLDLSLSYHYRYNLSYYCYWNILTEFILVLAHDLKNSTKTRLQ